MSAAEFDSLANDTTPLGDIGVRGMIGEVLDESGIREVSDLVNEFRKEEPFATIMGIGVAKSAALRQLLLEYQAKRSNPKRLVKFLLSQSQIINYLMIPSIVAIVFLAASLLGLTHFGRDDAFTILLVLVSLVVFELGHWSCDPTLVRRPWTVGRTRILAVLLTLGAIRMALSKDYGWTEAGLYVSVGTLLGLMDGAITWARREAIRNDEPIRTADRAAAGHLFESLTHRLRSASDAVLVAVIAGMFTFLSAIIAMVQAIVIETIKN